MKKRLKNKYEKKSNSLVLQIQIDPNRALECIEACQGMKHPKSAIPELKRICRDTIRVFNQLKIDYPRQKSSINESLEVVQDALRDCSDA